MEDCFHKFFELYEQGNVLSAWSQILCSPTASYDSLTSVHPLLPLLVNYVDASAFDTIRRAYLTNLSLTSALLKENLFPQAVDRLKLEIGVMNKIMTNTGNLTAALERFVTSERSEEILHPDEIKETIATAPAELQEWLKQQLALSQGWIQFKHHHPRLAAVYQAKEFDASRPWQPIKYPEGVALGQPRQGTVPLIFLEPQEGEYAELVESLRKQPAVFVFDTRAKLIQMLQFPVILESLSDDAHRIYIMELYPNEQILAQKPLPTGDKPFHPLFDPAKTYLSNALPVFLTALKTCLQQDTEVLKSDSDDGNWLYHICKRFLFATEQHRLGKERIPALLERNTVNAWYDPHKAPPPIGRDLGPEPPDHMNTLLQNLSTRRSPWKKRIRLVHVVPQVVDGGHAPSRLLENLMVLHDRTLFDLCLISTERFQFHPHEYPFSVASSDSSVQRAPKRLQLFRSLEVKVHVFDSLQSYEKTAQAIASMLQQIRADVAVFHGPDVINTMCAQCVGIPLRILFEHGTPPDYSGFDLVIASSRDAPEIYRDRFAKLGAKVIGLPFAIDVRAQWEPQPYSKEELGIPRHALAMTTVSNRLDSRLGAEMSLAIVEILQRVPQAYYTPMGSVFDEERLRQPFKEHGVNERVIFLGRTANPSQTARSMDLYLNEFPFGSCLGMLDAMASGCPVVTMYDRNGPPQARYGGDFMGLERSIMSGKREDYVNLACKLLTDPHMHQEWSEHTKQHYEKHADVASYVKAFEAIVKNALQ